MLAMWAWPWEAEYWVDVSLAYNMALGGILLIAGLFALALAPGRLLKFLLGFGMMGVGILLLTGYWAVF